MSEATKWILKMILVGGGGGGVILGYIVSRKIIYSRDIAPLPSLKLGVTIVYF